MRREQPVRRDGPESHWHASRTSVWTERGAAGEESKQTGRWLCAQPWRSAPGGPEEPCEGCEDTEAGTDTGIS